MTEKISIRQAPTAKVGLMAMIKYINDITPVQKMTMVEVGSFVGDAAEIFAQNFKHVTCVDEWKNGYDDSDPSSFKWDMRIIEAQFDELCDCTHNIRKVKNSSVVAAETFEKESLDFVYIDANHLYDFVKQDLTAWLPKIKKSGFIGGHDWQHKRAPGVKPAVLKIIGQPDKTFSETSWIKKL